MVTLHQNSKFILLFSSVLLLWSILCWESKNLRESENLSLSTHLQCCTTGSQDVGLLRWCPPCEWQVLFLWQRSWSEALRMLLVCWMVVDGGPTQYRVELWMSEGGCPDRWLWSRKVQKKFFTLKMDLISFCVDQKKIKKKNIWMMNRTGF